MHAVARNVDANPSLAFVSSCAVLLAILGYVFPAFTMVGSVPIYWLSILSSLVLVLFFCLRVSIFGRIRHSNTKLDLLVQLYILWALLGFFLNFLVNSITANADHQLAQIQSLAGFLLVLPHYYFGRFFDSFGFSFSKFKSYLVASFFLVCCSALVYILSSESLYQAREIIGQRFPLLVVFWAWFFGGIWLITRQKRYFLVFLLGTLICILSLTRAAYLQWVACAIAMFFAVGARNMLKVTAYVAVMMTVVTSIAYSFYDSIVSTVTERLTDYLFYVDFAEGPYSPSDRFQVWAGIGRYLIENPLTLIVGYGQMGPSGFSLDFIDTYGEWIQSTNAHSQYLDTVVRMGIPGLVIELCINFVAVFVTLFRRGDPAYLKIVAACLVGHLVYGVFHESVRWQVFGMVFWFFIGIIARHSEKRHIPKSAKFEEA